MKTPTLILTTLFAVLTSAAPAENYFRAQITFEGAAGASFSLSVPTDGTLFTISNPLSVSKITSLGGATCGFHGIDGSETVVVGAQTVDVGPPQTQISGSCLKF